MFQTARIAFRNIFRSKRRTLMLMSSITIGVVALVLISGFVSSIRYALYTSIVRAEGHVQIMPENYLDLGGSSPGSYYIEDWQAIAKRLQSDPVLQGKIRVIAPALRLGGVASYSESGASLGFRGAGLIPELYNEMQQWDDFDLQLDPNLLILNPDDKNLVLTGTGMAQQLQICEFVTPKGCQDYSTETEPTGPIDQSIAYLGDLAAEDSDPVNPAYENKVSIDLMVASADGAPNARSVWVQDAVTQAQRQVDNSFITMHLKTAQNLLYEDQTYVSTIMVQFHSNDFAATGIERIKTVLAGDDTAYDVLTVEEFNSTFTRVVGMFTVVQIFVGLVVCLIILFMVANTMAIIVMERVNEIGTLRALGQYRSGIRNLFLTEGMLLGAISATVGVIVAAIVVYLINSAGLEWNTPNSIEPTPIRILFGETPVVIAGIWLLIAIVAMISSVLPAIRAARYSIADALRHV